MSNNPIEIEKIKKELSRVKSHDNSTTKDLLRFMQECSAWLKERSKK